MDLIPLIENPELMNRTTLAELQALVDEFPCMQVARLLLVENAFRLDESDYRTEAEKAAVLIPAAKCSSISRRVCTCTDKTRATTTPRSKKQTHRREQISRRR